VSLRAAILGFLELEPTTGYSLRQRFEGSVASFWTVTQSQIYRELHALEREGRVTVSIEPGSGKPDRKVYATTPAGRAELAEWLAAPVPPLEMRHPLLLKFVFAAGVDTGVLDGVLARYEEGLVAARREYAARRDEPAIFSLARTRREAAVWRLSIDHGVEYCAAELAWVRRARRTLRAPRRAAHGKGKQNGHRGQGGAGHGRVERDRSRGGASGGG
jgi:PadR family transcriptional regulator AphA